MPIYIYNNFSNLSVHYKFRYDSSFEKLNEGRSKIYETLYIPDKSYLIISTGENVVLIINLRNLSLINKFEVITDKETEFLGKNMNNECRYISNLFYLNDGINVFGWTKSREIIKFKIVEQFSYKIMTIENILELEDGMNDTYDKFIYNYENRTFFINSNLKLIKLSENRYGQVEQVNIVDEVVDFDIIREKFGYELKNYSSNENNSNFFKFKELEELNVDINETEFTKKQILVILDKSLKITFFSVKDFKLDNILIKSIQLDNKFFPKNISNTQFNEIIPVNILTDFQDNNHTLFLLFNVFSKENNEKIFKQSFILIFTIQISFNGECEVNEIKHELIVFDDEYDKIIRSVNNNGLVLRNSSNNSIYIVEIQGNIINKNKKAVINEDDNLKDYKLTLVFNDKSIKCRNFSEIRSNGNILIVSPEGKISGWKLSN